MKIINLKQHEDSRGILVENTSAEILLNAKHFFVSKSAPGVVRGNHYHKRKLEWFYIIQGICQIVVEDIVTKQREEKIIRDRENSMVLMETNKAHAFKNIGDNEMILFALLNEVYNPLDNDTFPFAVL